MKRHPGPYSHMQKIGKLSSVAPGEQCNDILRSCRNHVRVLKPWKVHSVNIIVPPVTLTDVHDHLYRYGGFPPLVDVRLGLPGIHSITQQQGKQYEIDPGMADQP